MTYDVFSGTLNPAQSQSFPGQPASAGCRSLSSYPCSAREALGYYGMLLGAGCPSCHPTNSIKALNETKQHRPTSLVLSLSNTGHPGGGFVARYLHQLSDDSAPS